MDAQTMVDVDLFFEDPRTSHASNSGRKWGTLHLLRRDIIRCFGEDPETGTKTVVFALWPGAMAILAGVDLLGKFWRGDDSTCGGEVGKRFRDFLGEYFHLSQKDAEVIYQLRNSLLHSFGLYSKTRGKSYKFVLSQTLGRLMLFQGTDTYKVDIQVLRAKFEDAISEYQQGLMNDETLQDNFVKMFSDYGSVNIG